MCTLSKLCIYRRTDGRGAQSNFCRSVTFCCCLSFVTGCRRSFFSSLNKIINSSRLNDDPVHQNTKWNDNNIRRGWILKLNLAFIMYINAYITGVPKTRLNEDHGDLKMEQKLYAWSAIYRVQLPLLLLKIYEKTGFLDFLIIFNIIYSYVREFRKNDNHGNFCSLAL